MGDHSPDHVESNHGLYSLPNDPQRIRSDSRIRTGSPQIQNLLLYPMSYIARKSRSKPGTHGAMVSVGVPAGAKTLNRKALLT